MPRLFRLLLIPALLSGCDDGASSTRGRTTANAPHFDPYRPVELVVASTADLGQEIVAHRGSVVLLDSWFLACGACVKKFPHIVELSEKYGPDGLVVMSVNVFEDELSVKDEVLKFLRDRGAAFPNFILTDPDTFREQYNAPNNPAVILFDRDGRRIDIPTNPRDEVLEDSIRKALGIS